MLIKLKVSEVLNGVILLVFKNAYEAGMSMCRIQEFYESPSNKTYGKYFSLEDYMDFYTKRQKCDSFDYMDSYAGYNVPGKVFIKWLDMYRKKKDVRDKELAVINAVFSKGDRKKIKQSYIIAVYANDKQLNANLNHEISHAMFSFDSEYHRSCMKLIKSIRPKTMERHRKFLFKNYCRGIWNDEIQAYSSTGGYSSIRGRKDFEKNFRFHLAKLKKLEGK